MTRITPPNQRPAHTEVMMWLRDLATTLEVMSECQTMEGRKLRALIAEWRQTYRQELFDCGGPSILVNRTPDKFQSVHRPMVEAVDELIMHLDGFWSWPTPEYMCIVVADLRRYASELGQCRE